MKNAEAAISSRWGGGVKSLRKGEAGGLKTFRTEGGYFCWGVSTSLQAMKMKLENESELLMLDMY